jgi:hypothetical protein
LELQKDLQIIVGLSNKISSNLDAQSGSIIEISTSLDLSNDNMKTKFNEEFSRVVDAQKNHFQSIGDPSRVYSKEKTEGEKWKKEEKGDKEERAGTGVI